MRVFDIIAWILLVVGGLNWGLVALNYNPVYMLLGPDMSIWVYAAVGIAAIYAILRKMFCTSCCK